MIERDELVEELARVSHATYSLPRHLHTAGRAYGRSRRPAAPTNTAPSRPPTMASGRRTSSRRSSGSAFTALA